MGPSQLGPIIGCMNSTRVATLGLLLAVAMLLIAIAHGPATSSSGVNNESQVALLSR